MKKTILILCFAATTLANANLLEKSPSKSKRSEEFISPKHKTPVAPMVMLPPRVEMFLAPDYDELRFLLSIDPRKKTPQWDQSGFYQEKITASKIKSQSRLTSRQFRPFREWINGTKRSRI